MHVYPHYKKTSNLAIKIKINWQFQFYDEDFTNEQHR